MCTKPLLAVANILNLQFRGFGPLENILEINWKPRGFASIRFVEPADAAEAKYEADGQEALPTEEMNPAEVHCEVEQERWGITKSLRQLAEGVVAAMVKRSSKELGMAFDSEWFSTRPAQAARAALTFELLKANPLDLKALRGHGKEKYDDSSPEQSKTIQQFRIVRAPAKVYVIGNAGADPDNVVCGVTFLPKQLLSYILYLILGPIGFVLTAFSAVIDCAKKIVRIPSRGEYPNSIRGDGM
ncbi:putative reverse transcriptase domain-containing protein [Tanacetum coccineum]|uniref:Reverse transcriptase domain-containing protein n=1 Tax=Tanacetum coccineum TaxID=301880 RepID=A0ABQ5F594_9ASTR